MGTIRLRTLFWMLLLSAGFAGCKDSGAPAEYLGGTLATMETGAGGSLRTNDPISLVFLTKKNAVRVPYERINLVEYGQKVDRRLTEAILISPLLILSRSLL